MVLTQDDDRATIATCFNEKGWRGARLLKEFPGRRWNRSTVNRFIKRLEETGSSKRKVGRGRSRSARAANRDTVGNEILSQEDQPGTHKSQRKLATQMNIGQSSVSRIVKDLGLKS